MALLYEQCQMGNKSNYQQSGCLGAHFAQTCSVGRVGLRATCEPRRSRDPLLEGQPAPPAAPGWWAGRGGISHGLMGPPPADPSLIADAVHSGDRASVPPGFGSYRTARRRAQRTRALLRLRDFCTARCRPDHQEEGNTPPRRMYEYEEPERQALHHDEPLRGGTLAPPPGLERGGEDATGAPPPPPHTGPTPQQKASMDKFRAMFEVGAFRPEALLIQELEEAGCPPQHIKELFPEMEKAGCSPEGREAPTRDSRPPDCHEPRR